MDGPKRALVVGIDAYGGGIPPLGSAVNDAEAIAEKLKEAHDYRVDLLRDAEATTDTIMASLTAVADEGLAEDSSFVLYYAGHGVAADDREGTGPQGYLLTHDAHPKNQETWLGMESLRGALDPLACRHVMLVLDCCYAGAFQWTSTRSIGSAKRPLYKSQYERYRSGTAWQVLTSASSDEKADDVAPVTSDRGGATAEGHSPFAQALIEALSGNAADSSRGGIAADGVITATELYQFIYEKVAVNDRQTPGIFPLKHDNKGEFVFLAPGVELNLEPDPPLDDANNPWLGADAYTATDGPLFFGREQVTGELVARVAADRFVAVVGASGSGKSSLIRAGLVPALEDPTWAVADPSLLTDDPTELVERARLELAAAPPSERQLVVFDQFEALLTHPDDGVRARVIGDIRGLVESDDGPTVVVGLRSGFEPLAAAGLGDVWRDDVRFPVPVFSPHDLRSIAIGPARAKAVFFEPAEIVDDLVHAVTEMPAAAPLLSFTLSELYIAARARRQATGASDRMISTEDVEAVGGVVGVLHRRASELFDSLDDEQQAITRRVFLRLIDQRPDHLGRRSIDPEELRFGPELDQHVDCAVEAFVGARLLSVGGHDGRTLLEAGHDDLVTTWDHQLSWLAQSGSQEVIRDVWRVANRWNDDDRKRTSKHLWNQDPRLAELERHHQHQELNALEQEFRTASSSRQRRLARIRRVAVITLMILTVAAISAGAFALVKRAEANREADRANQEADRANQEADRANQEADRANQEAERATRQAERASSRALASDALNNVTIETDLAALLALESVRVANTADARGSLAGVLSVPTRFLQRTHVHDEEITAIAFSETGRSAATADAAGVIRIWEVNEDPSVTPQATPVGDPIESGVAIRDLYVSGDDQRELFVFSEAGDLFFLDLESEVIEPDVLTPPDEFVAVTLNLRAGFLAGFGVDGVLRVYAIDEDLEFPEVSTLVMEPGNVTELVISPDGSMLAWAEGTLFHVWSRVEGGEPFIADVESEIRAIDFSPDSVDGRPVGAVVAVGAEDGTVYVADRNDPDLIGPVFPAPVNQLFDLAFKPDVNDLGDGNVTFTFASTHSNGDVNLFDVGPGDGAAPFGFAVETMQGHNDEAKELAFAPDGRIASGAFSGEIIWWLDVPVSSLGVAWPDEPGPPMRDAVFLTPSQIVSLDVDYTAWLADVAASEVDPVVEELAVTSIDAAGDVIAVGLADGRAQILDPDGTPVRSLEADHPLHVGLVALSSDGRRLATVSPWDQAGFLGHLAIWDVATGTLVNEQDLPEGFEPYSALFADDGTLWLGGRDIVDLPMLLKIDGTTGAVVSEAAHSSKEGNAVTALAIADDGRTLAAGSMDRGISLWDVDTFPARLGGEFVGHRGNVTGIVFWDDGETLISADDAGDILMWDVSERRRFAQLGGPTDDVTSLEVDADSATLLASGDDGFLWTWSLSPEVWRDRACQLASRNMTDAEWALYGDGGTRVRHCVDLPAEDGEVSDADYGEALTD